MGSGLDVMIDGKMLKDWLKSDEGMVDYSKCETGVDVSNNPEYRIYDIGGFVHDPSVMETRYHNGVDLARVAGVATSYRDEGYDDISVSTAMDGDLSVQIFFNSLKDATIQDFVYRYFHIIDGDIYISETNHRVFIKGRKGTDEEIEKFIDDFNSRII